MEQDRSMNAFPPVRRSCSTPIMLPWALVSTQRTGSLLPRLCGGEGLGMKGPEAEHAVNSDEDVPVTSPSLSPQPLSPKRAREARADRRQACVETPRPGGSDAAAVDEGREEEPSTVFAPDRTPNG